MNERRVNDFDSLAFFHHIHHINGNHIVHHCGRSHARIDFKLDYEINHCGCNKHSINMKEAIGHDFEFKEVLIEFNEKCPEGGWHVESGRIMEEDKND